MKARPTGSSALRRTATVTLWGLAAGHLVEAAILRSRNRALRAVDDPGSTPATLSPTAIPTWRTVRLSALTAPPALVGTVQGVAEAGNLDVVDVVPRRLSVSSALQYLRRVDQAKLATKVFSSPGGAGHLVVASPATAERAALATEDVAVDTTLDVVATTRTLQRCAPLRSGALVSDALTAHEPTAAEQWQAIVATTRPIEPYRRLAPLLLGAQGAHLGAMIAGLFVNPMAAAAALATWCAEPLLVFTGASSGGDRAGAGHQTMDAGLRPPDLATSSVLRPVHATRQWIATVQAALAARRSDPYGWSSGLEAPPAAVAPPEGVSLFEPERADCPWCGAGTLRTRLVTPDLLQHKPGTFKLDECTACGHVFQNPRLSIAGLDYYYADFYDGLGEETFEVFNSVPDEYERRLGFVTRHTDPKSWLDVGAGVGHFAVYARQELPEATFAGVDLSAAVHDGRRRGWLDEGHQGLLPDLVSELEGRYDVVSLFHCLEHTLDPAAELDAVTKVLPSGGHLMIELPNPECDGARLFGKYWFPWFQPQHLHFVPCDNLLAALEQRGYDIIEVDRRVSGDLNGIGAVALWGHDQAPSTYPLWPDNRPGRPRAVAPAVLAASLPLGIAALAADGLSRVLRRGDLNASAYCVLARKR